MSLYWICQFAGWIGTAVLFFTLQLSYGAKYENARQYSGWLLYIIGGIALTHAFRALLKRLQWTTLPPLRLIGIGLAGALACGLLLGVVVMTGIAFAMRQPAQWSIGIGAFINSLFVIVGWICLYFGTGLYRAAQQSRLEALSTRLQALESQVNPHFLFNSLNSVRALIIEDPKRATEMVTQLADLLRYALRSDRQTTVTLDEELAIVENYLAIERTRFDDRLRVSIQVDDAARQTRIPPMLLQTLVENAIKHGIARLTEGGAVTIVAQANGNGVTIDIRNPGAWSPPASPGVGLRNARERLRLLYGDRAKLQVGEESPGAIRAHLEIA